MIRCLDSDGVEVRLYDPDRGACVITARSVRTRARAEDDRHKVVITPSVSSAVADADLIVHLYRVGGAHGRLDDERFAQRHDLLAQETNGLVAASQAIRNLAALDAVAPEILTRAPTALNVICSNPVGILTTAAARLGLPTIGLCELPHAFGESLVKHGITLEYETLRLYGLNHCWFVVGTDRRSGTEVAMADPHLLARVYRDTVLDSTPDAVCEELVRMASLMSALPSPYWQYHMQRKSPRPATLRAEEVLAVNKEIMASLAHCDFSLYDALLAKRGGYRLETVVARLAGAYLGSEEVSRISVCMPTIRDPSSHLGSSQEAVVEVTARSVRPRADESSVPAAVEALVSPIDSFEAGLVNAWVRGDAQAIGEAVLAHPLVRSPTAVMEWLDTHGPWLGRSGRGSDNDDSGASKPDSPKQVSPCGGTFSS